MCDFFPDLAVRVPRGACSGLCGGFSPLFRCISSRNCSCGRIGCPRADLAPLTRKNRALCPSFAPNSCAPYSAHARSARYAPPSRTHRASLPTHTPMRSVYGTHSVCSTHMYAYVCIAYTYRMLCAYTPTPYPYGIGICTLPHCVWGTQCNPSVAVGMLHTVVHKA
jgi:hypothetical protein